MLKETIFIPLILTLVICFGLPTLEAADKNTPSSASGLPSVNTSEKILRGKTLPSQHQLPESPSVPGAGGGFNTLPEHATEPVRQAAMRPRITGFTGYSVCVDSASSATNTLRIRGFRFGSTRGSRNVMIFLPVRHARVREAVPLSWSDNEILLELPRPGGDYQPGRPYEIAIMENGSVISNYSNRFEVCRTDHRLAGEITLDNCPASPADVTVTVEGGPYGRRYTSHPVVSTRSDFALSYSFDDLPGGDYTVRVGVGADSCRGGHWSPVERRVSLGHRNASAMADFRYSVGMATVPIPITLVRGLLNDMLTGTSIRLHNYRGTNDSYIQLPDGAGGLRRGFSIPVFSRDPFTYYVNDINLSGLAITSNSTGLIMGLQFETVGPEIAKRCQNNAACGLADHIDMDLNIDAYFTLVRHVHSSGGVAGISIGDVRVEANPNAQMRGVCSVVDLCDAITNYKSMMKRAIEDGVQAVLDNYRFRNSVYEALRPTLDAFDIGNVESVTVSGGRNFLIRHTPL